MADLDLGTALNMFKDGVNSLALTSAINQANDQVSQIKANVADETQQRSQMQQVSNNLVAHMATFGTPATTMDAVSKAIGPKQYANANDMNRDALLTGNSKLGDMADTQQEFENNKAFELAKIRANARNNPVAQAAAQERADKFTQTEFDKYGKTLDAGAASSRSAFGQWAQTEGKGSRIQAILGDKSHWAHLTGPELQLATESTGAMAKGGVLSKEESAALQAHSAQLWAARKVSETTGKPVAVDLSEFAGLYSKIADREDQNAKSKMLDVLTNSINAHASLAKRNPDQFNLTTAKALAQVGKTVDPSTIQVDPKKGVIIPGVTDVLDAAASAPKHVKQALADANGSDSVARASALKFLGSFGVSPTMDPKDAAKMVQRKIKASVFDQ